MLLHGEGAGHRGGLVGMEVADYCRGQGCTDCPG
jgi:hypothetical protein